MGGEQARGPAPHQAAKNRVLSKNLAESVNHYGAFDGRVLPRDAAERRNWKTETPLAAVSVDIPILQEGQSPR
jgi:hypothetical protein